VLFANLLKVRYMAVVVSVLSILHALAFLFMGAQLAVKAYRVILGGVHGGDAARPALELLHSLDFLLISLVLLILALGVTKLFLLTPHMIAGRSSHLPSWLNIETFSDLKVILWETILTAMLVFGLPTLTVGLLAKLDWTALVLPGAILLLAVSLYFIRRT
jgi:uncharacterized membrane protein YqhA